LVPIHQLVSSADLWSQRSWKLTEPLLTLA